MLPLGARVHKNAANIADLPGGLYHADSRSEQNNLIGLSRACGSDYIYRRVQFPLSLLPQQRHRIEEQIPGTARGEIGRAHV